MARIRAVLRRKAPEGARFGVEVGVLRIDPATRRVTRGDAEVKSARPNSGCCTSS